MEKNIFLIGTRKITSKKNNKDYFMVDYVREGTPKTDYISELEFTNIRNKNKNMKEVTGIFNINLYDKAYLCDVK